jgi:RNA recognition motif-containing protein
MLLKVDGISDKIGEERLKELFSEVGAVESVRIIRDIYTGTSKGFGFVEFATMPKKWEST